MFWCQKKFFFKLLVCDHKRQGQIELFRCYKNTREKWETGWMK